MKKRFFYLLFALLCLLCAMVFVSCDDKENTPPVCQHRDADDNALCDKCGEAYTDGTDTKPACDHSDADGNALCDKCGEAYTAAADNAIGFKTLTVNGTNVYGKVSNATTLFSFLTEVKVLSNATFKVFSDLECKDNIESKTTSLAPGDNIFYILEYVNGEANTLYTVTIRRKPMYTVTFDTADGTAIPAQTVEEDTVATRPTDPTRAGYTFKGWAYDFTTPVTGDTAIVANWQGEPYTVTYDANGGAVTTPTLAVTFGEGYTLATPARVGYTFDGWYYGSRFVVLTGTWSIAENVTLVAEWTPNSGTSYKVEHYTENLDGTWELQDTDNLVGTSDSEVTPATKFYAYFTTPAKQTVTIVPDGTLVVRYEYTRRNYTVTFVTNGGDAIAAQDFKYGVSLDTVLPTPVRTGYTFGGWFTNVGLTTAVTTVPAGNTTVYAHWAEENKPGDFFYSGTNGFTIDGYNTGDTSVVIPTYIGGKPVITIGDDAFESCTGLTSITIPARVTSIGSGAFYNCTGLTSVTFGENSQLTSIGRIVFAGCSSLASITIPEGVMSIGPSAFLGCTGLMAVTFDENSQLQIIDFCAFYNCTGLTSITIPEGVMSIGSYAFDGCDGLTSITIPASVTSIGSGAFRGCSGLESITVASGNTKYHSAGNCLIETATKTLILGCKNSVIPTDGSVTSIGYNAFSRCTGLTSITIPASVTTIGDDAFYGCTGLTSITIPASVTSIGSYAFYGCTGLTSITIPASVTSIGWNAFEGCTNLTSVTFEQTSGWKAGSVNVSPADLANTATAAKYLTVSYTDTWSRD